MAKIIPITRKIQLIFNTDNPDEVIEYFNTIRRWHKICHAAANMIASHQFMLDNEAGLVYMHEGAKLRLGKWSKEDPLNALVTSRTNATYQLISAKVKGEIPTAIITALNSTIIRTYTAEQKDYFLGKKSLRSYKANIPVPFPSVSVINMRKHVSEYKGKKHDTFAFTLLGIPFIAMFGKDLSGNKSIWERMFSKRFLPAWVLNNEDNLSQFLCPKPIVETSETEELKPKEDPVMPDSCSCVIGEYEYLFEKVISTASKLVDDEDEPTAAYYYNVTVPGTDVRFKMQKRIKGKEDYWGIISEYKFCDSSIMIDDNGKIFMLATVQFEKEKRVLSPEKIGNCYLDIDIPIVLKIPGHERDYQIGSKEEFIHRRVALQEAVRRQRRAMKYSISQVSARGGDGRRGIKRARKMQALQKVEKMEGSYVDHKMHVYSRDLINLALKYGIGTLVLKNQTEKEQRAKEDEFLLRNWSYYKLGTYITYKAGREGILVVVE